MWVERTKRISLESRAWICLSTPLYQLGCSDALALCPCLLDCTLLDLITPFSLQLPFALDNLHSRALWFVCWRWWVQSGDWLGIVGIFIMVTYRAFIIPITKSLLFLFRVLLCVYMSPGQERTPRLESSRPVHCIIRINKNDHVPPDHGEGDGS